MTGMAMLMWRGRSFESCAIRAVDMSLGEPLSDLTGLDQTSDRGVGEQTDTSTLRSPRVASRLRGSSVSSSTDMRITSSAGLSRGVYAAHDPLRPVGRLRSSPSLSARGTAPRISSAVSRR